MLGIRLSWWCHDLYKEGIISYRIFTCPKRGPKGYFYPLYKKIHCPLHGYASPTGFGVYVYKTRTPVNCQWCLYDFIEAWFMSTLKHPFILNSSTLFRTWFLSSLVFCVLFLCSYFRSRRAWYGNYCRQAKMKNCRDNCHVVGTLSGTQRRHGLFQGLFHSLVLAILIMSAPFT